VVTTSTFTGTTEHTLHKISTKMNPTPLNVSLFNFVALCCTNRRQFPVDFQSNSG